MNDLLLGVLIGFGTGLPTGIVLADGVALIRAALQQRKHEKENG